MAASILAGHSLKHLVLAGTLALIPSRFPSKCPLSLPCPVWKNYRHLFSSSQQSSAVGAGLLPLSSMVDNPSVSGAEEALMGFIMGKRKATEVAHSIWENVVRKGDAVVDATCGNGYDTLALLKMVADESNRGFVYGMDIQKSAIESTSTLLDESVNPEEREQVKLFPICHSKMEDVVPKGTLVRLIAFNLGYLPGGDKAVITMSQTTLLALQSASRILESGGLISLVVYVGHPGGREEFETVQSFASGLSAECWVCCKLEVLNRPMAPILVLLFKK